MSTSTAAGPSALSTRSRSRAAASLPTTTAATTPGPSPSTASHPSPRRDPYFPTLGAVDFIRYAEGSAALVNADLPDGEALVAHLAHRAWLHRSCTDRDATVLRRFQRELRPVFEASEEGEAQGVITGLNELMERHPITPMISDHDPDDLHMH